MKAVTRTHFTIHFTTYDKHSLYYTWDKLSCASAELHPEKATHEGADFSELGPTGGTSCRGQVQTTVPDPGLDSDGVRLFFGRLGFPEEEMVALMGAHTLGRFTSLLGDIITRPTSGFKETYYRSKRGLLYE